MAGKDTFTLTYTCEIVLIILSVYSGIGEKLSEAKHNHSVNYCWSGTGVQGIV